MVVFFAFLKDIYKIFLTSFFNHLFFKPMNIYVANISFRAREQDLKELFQQFGEVSSVKVVTDRDTGRSRGFGFVEMDSDEDAKKAIAGLNNKEVEGRAMSVSVAKPKKTDNKRW